MLDEKKESQNTDIFAFKFIAYTHNYNVSLKALLQQCISEPVFYGDYVYSSEKVKKRRQRTVIDTIKYHT